MQAKRRSWAQRLQQGGGARGASEKAEAALWLIGCRSVTLAWRALLAWQTGAESARQVRERALAAGRMALSWAATHAAHIAMHVWRTWLGRSERRRLRRELQGAPAYIRDATSYTAAALSWIVIVAWRGSIAHGVQEAHITYLTEAKVQARARTGEVSVRAATWLLERRGREIRRQALRGWAGTLVAARDARHRCWGADARWSSPSTPSSDEVLNRWTLDAASGLQFEHDSKGEVIAVRASFGKIGGMTMLMPVLKMLLAWRACVVRSRARQEADGLLQKVSHLRNEHREHRVRFREAAARTVAGSEKGALSASFLTWSSVCQDQRRGRQARLQLDGVCIRVAAWASSCRANAATSRALHQWRELVSVGRRLEEGERMQQQVGLQIEASRDAALWLFTRLTVERLSLLALEAIRMWRAGAIATRHTKHTMWEVARVRNQGREGGVRIAQRLLDAHSRMLVRGALFRWEALSHSSQQERAAERLNKDMVRIRTVGQLTALHLDTSFSWCILLKWRGWAATEARAQAVEEVSAVSATLPLAKAVERDERVRGIVVHMVGRLAGLLTTSIGHAALLAWRASATRVRRAQRCNERLAEERGRARAARCRLVARWSEGLSMAHARAALLDWRSRTQHAHHRDWGEWDGGRPTLLLAQAVEREEHIRGMAVHLVGRWSGLLTRSVGRTSLLAWRASATRARRAQRWDERLAEERGRARVARCRLVARWSKGLFMAHGRAALLDWRSRTQHARHRGRADWDGTQEVGAEEHLLQDVRWLRSGRADKALAMRAFHAWSTWASAASELACTFHSCRARTMQVTAEAQRSLQHASQLFVAGERAGQVHTLFFAWRGTCVEARLGREAKQLQEELAFLREWAKMSPPSMRFPTEQVAKRCCFGGGVHGRPLATMKSWGDETWLLGKTAAPPAAPPLLHLTKGQCQHAHSPTKAAVAVRGALAERIMQEQHLFSTPLKQLVDAGSG